MVSGQFAVAAHVVALLTLVPEGEGLASDVIAGSVSTHPAFVRRVVGQLVAAGLVAPKVGRGGGYRLARPADRISLADLYRAVGPDAPFGPRHGEPNPMCRIGSGIGDALGAVTRSAQASVERELARVTVADLAAAAERAGVGKRTLAVPPA